jgi:hypothetical protein
VEEEFAAGDDDARAARYGEWDCGGTFKIREVDRRQLKVESGRVNTTERWQWGLALRSLAPLRMTSVAIGCGCNRVTDYADATAGEHATTIVK